MKTLLLSVFILVFTIAAFGCSCGPTPFLLKYQRSDFIATAKITSLVQDPKDAKYHDIEVELINVYKGTSIKNLKITSSLMSSCAFLPDKNSTWLIFASKDQLGILSFGFCSGSVQIDRKFDLVQYPNLDKRYKESIELKLEALSFLQKSNISTVNEFDLVSNDFRICSENFKGFEEKNRFAVYEVTITTDLKVQEVKVLRGFSNKDLSDKFTACIQSNLQIDQRKRQTIPVQTKLILLYFQYLPAGSDPSFISTWDL